MSRIQKLPDSLANKIAAGEVVQRPESVVKELVENALDAGATEVAVVVKNAGKSLIFIADNGSGMPEDDARIAFERHATSKISTDADLDRIMTLGFRGEALAAISSVAQVELKTRQQTDELGTLVRVENGVIAEVGKTACDRGTSIAVKNLFFSVPARRKFLKSNATELKHIVETMQRFALSYPHVTFTLSDDDALLLSVRGGTIEERITAVYNEEMLNAFLPFESSIDGVKATGYIGKPNFARKSKTDQYLFLNGRYITSKLLSHAIYTGYEHLLDPQSYPPYLLFLDVDPERVDVNVHPTKSEVKFDDESAIYTMLQQGARRCLGEHNLVPAMRMPSGADTGESVIAALRYALPQYDRAEKFPVPTRPASLGENGGAGSADGGGNGSYPGQYQRERPMPSGRAGELMRQLFGEPTAASVAPLDAGAAQLNASTQQATFRHEARPIDGDVDPERAGLWQIHNKYILSQLRTGLMIVDQHVAHERILYEQAVKSMTAAMPMSQQLLFPLELKITPAEYAMMRELRNDIAALGFEMSLDRGDTVIVHGVPHDVRAGQEGVILRELLDQYIEYQQMGMTDQRHMIAASFACRASIKAGDPLSQEEMLNLIENLFTTSMPYVCPHGRPIVIRIELSELDRRFGRTS